MTQVWVPAGSFTMGSAEGSATPPPRAVAEFAGEQPAHIVRLTSGYWIDRTEVTNASYAAFAAAGGYTDRSLWSDAGWAWLQAQHGMSLPRPCGSDDPQLPRVCVTWFEAEAYAAWRGGRLPTEAEWEYAARGPKSTVYPWGDTWDETLANVSGARMAVEVGRYPKGASWVGALDLAGNAMEWVADWYSTTYYALREGVDPTGPSTGEIKIEKGGWWGSGPYFARSAYRHFEDAPGYQDPHIGLRIVTPGG